MNKIIVIIFLGLILLSCGEKKTTKKVALLNQKDSIFDESLDTSMVVILPLDTTHSWIFKNVKQAELTSNELSLIENILTNCIQEYNKKEKLEFRQLQSKETDAQFNINDFIIDLNKYKRQYIAVINSNGEKEVWVNCFCNSFDKDWRKQRIIVKDGGNCYFNLKINIETKKCYDFMANGSA